MAATAILSQGTTLTVDDGAGTPITINGISAITGLGSGTATEIETTTLASTAREYRQGLRDFGTLSIEFSRRDQDDAGQQELYDINSSQATREFVLTLSASTNDTATFDGFVTQITSDVNADGVVTGTATVRITGAVTWS